VPLPSGTWRRWPSLDGALGAAVTGSDNASAAMEEAIVYVRAGAVLPLLADNYDSLVTPRSDDNFDAGLNLAPATIPALRLLVVGGGTSEGEVDGYTIPATSWSFDGAGVSGPITGARLGSTELSACAAPGDTGCIQGAVVVLANGDLAQPITLETASGNAVLEITSDLTGVEVELR